MRHDMTSLLATALEITQAACAVPVREFHNRLKVDLKDDASPVTRADRETEAMICQALTAHFPGDGIYGEEYGIAGLDRPRVWVIDPIDGTKSFITGVPLFGMLMALVEQGETTLGLVRFPALDQVYAGARGIAATKNGQPIRPSDCTRLEDAVLYINEADKIYHALPKVFDRLMQAGRMRRTSYDCQPHMLVAEGRIDACVDFDLQPYDYLPVRGVIDAAGAMITDWQGRPLGFDTAPGRSVSAATPALHARMLELLNA